MNSLYWERRRIVIMCIFVLFLSACARTTQPSKFYMLVGGGIVAEEHPNIKPPTQDLAIGIGPVKFPEYLDRPQIVTREKSNELQLSEFNRWAGSLKEDFNRSLAENLSGLLSTDRVAIYPWRRSTPFDYQIELDIIRFDGSLGKEVELKARWAIFGDDGRKMYTVRTSNFKETAIGGDYHALVTALSNTVRALSLEIAQEVLKLSRQVPVD